MKYILINPTTWKKDEKKLESAQDCEEKLEKDFDVEEGGYSDEGHEEEYGVKIEPDFVSEDFNTSDSGICSSIFY